MLKYFYSLVILAHLVYAQDIDDEESREDFEWTTVKVWASTLGYNATLNAYCTDNCIKECVEPCKKAYECTDDEVNCGKKPLDEGVWPDCKRDDKCVKKGCECQVEGNDGSLCPLWCETKCDDTQKHCPGGVDENGCKEMATCINKKIGNDNQLCEGYCPKDCDPVEQNTCTVDPIDGCEQAPNCEEKSKDNHGEYCDEQQCTLACETTHKFCKGEQKVDGCWELDKCVPKDISDSGALCDGNCPITCNPVTEILCDGTKIYDGPKSGCFNDDQCVDKKRDCNGEFCKDSSASHGCPIVCKENEHACQPRFDECNCMEQATCTPCTLVDGKCCPPASDCPALCKPHEKECTPPGTDENGCPKPKVCVVQERDYYGELCQVHCPGVCNEHQIMCPGDRDDTGCPLPPTCHPIAKKQWGDDKGADCPGFCPAYCQDWEIACAAVQDPCDGCPTEPVCKPRAKNANQIYCPDESASHGCDISCKTLDGESTICPANDDETSPGCKEAKVCMVRNTGKDGKLCPEHSVCNKKCGKREKKCTQGMDSNDCRNEDHCVPYPQDQNGQDCLDFQCSPDCNEEIQKYCQGAYKLNENNQLCPLVDYCVDRPLDNNGHRCPGHCQPECNEGYEVVQQTGTDARGCLLGPVCNQIEPADA